MDISLFIGGIITLLFGIIFWILALERRTKNTEIEKQNQEIEEENNRIRQLNMELANKNIKFTSQKNSLCTEIKLLQEQKQQLIQEQEKAAENYFDILDLAYEVKENEFDTKIRLLQQDYENALCKAQNSFHLAFEKYVDNLDKEYTKAEQNFDIQIIEMKTAINKHQEELNKIQKTYAAAIEAQLREAEIEQSLDFFRLHLTTTEESTIALIEELKPRLPEPRVLCMLIWQTFYQRKMNGLCLNVLRKTVPVCGIYKITNRKTGLCYIGQSVDIAKRWKDHAKCGLGIDTPAQNKLYKAMLKDGLTNFSFELLEECERDLLNEKEKFYIELYQACDYGYNSTSGNN